MPKMDLERREFEKSPLLSAETANDDAPDFHCEPEKPNPNCSARSIVVIIINIVLFVISVTLFVSNPCRQPKAINADLKRVSAYSPLLETSQIPLVAVQTSGELFPAKDGSDGFGRREPGPETDKIWMDFEFQRKFAVSGDVIRKLGKDPAKTVKFPPEYGLGDDSYMVALDTFHQLHCLNMLRQEAFRDYYFDGKGYYETNGSNTQHERIRSEFFWIHLRHCTDILVQALMCNADTEMLTFTWMETQQNPWPDFSINKKCKSFDALLNWRDQHAEPWDKLNKLVKPFDLVSISEQYWQLFGNATVDGDNTHHPLW